MRPRPNVRREAMSDKGGQHVGPSVGLLARCKQENRDLKAEVERLMNLVAAHSVAIGELRELQTVVVGWSDEHWVPREVVDAIRKVKGLG